MTTAEEVCDRVAFVVEGRIVACDAPRALRLAHGGDGHVRVEYRGPDGLVTVAVPLAEAGRRLVDLPDGAVVETVHTSEASLEQVWGALLLVVPTDWRTAAIPWLLLLEVTTLGFVAAPALAVVERGNGVTQALRLTRLPPACALIVRVGLLAGYAAAAAVVLLAAARIGWSLNVLAAVAATSVLLSLVAVVMVGRAATDRLPRAQSRDRRSSAGPGTAGRHRPGRPSDRVRLAGHRSVPDALRR